MKQSTLTVSGFEVHWKATRKAEFLARMDKLVPWTEFWRVIAPFYPKSVNGRPPIGLERMMRMYFIAHWFNLAVLFACRSLIPPKEILTNQCDTQFWNAKVSWENV